MSETLNNKTSNNPKMWWENEKVEITLDVWSYTTKTQEVVEVSVSWDLEDEDEGRVSVSLSIPLGNNFHISSAQSRREFNYINFDRENDIKMLEEAKSNLVARIKNVHNDVSMMCEIKDLMREAEEEKKRYK